MLSSSRIVLRGLVDAAAATSTASVSPAVRKREFSRSAAVAKPPPHKGGDGIIYKDLAEYERRLFMDNIGRLRCEVPSGYSRIDSFTYKLSVDEGVEADALRMRALEDEQDRLADAVAVAAGGLEEYGDDDDQELDSKDQEALPLFGSIPALRAVEEVLKQQLNVTMDKLRLAEHYFHRFRPLPRAEPNLRSIVDLTDIVHRVLGSMIIFDVLTLNSNDTVYTYNQFCYQLRGVTSFGASNRSRRYVPASCNMMEDSFPQVHRDVSISARQECLMSRLMPAHSPEVDDKGNSLVHPITSSGTLGKALLDRLGVPQERFMSMKVQFPNAWRSTQPIRLSAWRMGRDKVLFHTLDYKRGEQPHFGGVIKLNS